MKVQTLKVILFDFEALPDCNMIIHLFLLPQMMLFLYYVTMFITNGIEKVRGGNAWV